MKNRVRRVVCAANRKRIGAPTLLIAPRHWDDTMREQARRLGFEDFTGEMWEQGFIDQHGVFLTRQEAFKVADEAGQIIRLVGSQRDFWGLPNMAEYYAQELYSENLY